MQTVRRVYTFLICAIALQAVAWALVGLAWQFIETYNIGTTAFLIAVIVAGLPIYLVHWLWTSRLARTDPGERESNIRWFYLYAMLAGFLAPMFLTALNLLGYWFTQVFGVPNALAPIDTPSRVRTVSAHELATIVVLGTFWLYHWQMVRRETRAAPLAETNSAIRRLYLLLFSGAGLLAAVWAAAGLVHFLLSAMTAAPLAGRAFLGQQIAQVLAGVPLWLAGWLAAQRLYASGAADERDSAMRKLYLYLAIGVAVAVTVTNATIILAGLFRSGLGLPASGDLREPLSWIVVWGVVWAYHAIVLRGDMQRGIGPRQAAVRRLYRYLVAGIALAAFLGGVIGDLTVMIRVLAGEAFGAPAKEMVAWFSAAIVSGLAVWVFPWQRAQADALRAGTAGADERHSTIRKIYLYLYVFAATVSVLGGAVYVMFRLLSIALGEPFRGNLLADLGSPLATVTVAVLVWLYHGAALRGDGRRLAAEKADRQAGMQVAVVDVGQGAFGIALLAELHREYPSLALLPVGLTAEAAQAMGGNGAQAVEHIAAAKLIVGPWQIAVAGGAVSAEIAGAVAASPAHKLLVPSHADNWDWVGGESGSDQARAHETARAVKQLLDGEDINARGPSPWLMLIGGVLGLWLLLSIFSMVMTFVTTGFGP